MGEFNLVLSAFAMNAPTGNEVGESYDFGEL